MNTRRRSRRATTIDVVDNIPTEQEKNKKLTRKLYSNDNSEMNNSNPETEMQTMNENEHENETVTSQNSNMTEDESADSTEPLFAGSGLDDILAQADLLLAEYTLVTSSQQNNATAIQQPSSDTEQNPSTSTANDQTLDERSARKLNRKRSAENINRTDNDSAQSTSTANQSHYDDSVILIDDGAMPRPNRCDEDVIFVEEYVKEPPRITGVVDLCDEDEDESTKKQKLTPMSAVASSAFAALAVQLPTSPVASTSNSIIVKCPVCLDSVPKEEVFSTVCGHLYCHPCIFNAIKTNKKCPMCNRKLTQKLIHRIYFHS